RLALRAVLLSPASEAAAFGGVCSRRTRNGTPLGAPSINACGLLDLDEDALPGALLGRLDHGILEAARDRGQSFDPTRVVQHRAAVLHIGEAVVEQGEHVGTELLAQAVAGAEVLVDPDLHGHRLVTYLSALGWPATYRPVLRLSIYPETAREIT